MGYLPDTETSQGNVFAAGNIDLKVDHTRQTYNGVDCKTCSVVIQSDTTNMVVEKDGDPVTPYPAELPTPADDWAEPFNNAIWIWGETGRPAPEDRTSYTFEKTFDWWGPVNDAVLVFDLEIAADDDYEVVLNGNSVVSDTDAWEETVVIELDEEDIVQGENVIRFTVENSGGWYAGLLYELEITRDNCDEGVAGFQNSCMLWGETDLDDSHRFWNFGDIKPGDWGTNVISLHVYDNDAYLCLNSFDEERDEPNGGNIADHITVFSWLDVNGDGEYDPEEDVWLNKGTLGDPASLASFEPGDNHYLPASSTEYISMAWCAGDIEVDEETGAISCDGSSVGNDAQGSLYQAGLMAYVEQMRNNEGFSCNGIELPMPPEMPH